LALDVAPQLAKAAGLKVIGTAGSAEGEELVRREGADHVLNHRADGYLDKVWTRMVGPDSFETCK
jgi:NADPH2:quinone reductase